MVGSILFAELDNDGNFYFVTKNNFFLFSDIRFDW